MSKTLGLIFLLVFSLSSLNAQKLTEDKMDEFTKVWIKRTSWAALTKDPSSMRPYRSAFRICKVNDRVYLQLKMMLNNSVYSIKEGSPLMFLLEGGDVVTINSNEYAITNYGDGAEGSGGSDNLGTNTTYDLSNEVIEKLLKGKITKIRIYTSEFFVEQEDKRNADKHLKRCLLLING
jgi:hypothetical protein